MATTTIILNVFSPLRFDMATTTTFFVPNFLRTDPFIWQLNTYNIVKKIKHIICQLSNLKNLITSFYKKDKLYKKNMETG